MISLHNELSSYRGGAPRLPYRHIRLGLELVVIRPPSSPLRRGLRLTSCSAQSDHKALPQAATARSLMSSPLIEEVGTTPHPQGLLTAHSRPPARPHTLTYGAQTDRHPLRVLAGSLLPGLPQGPLRPQEARPEVLRGVDHARGRSVASPQRNSPLPLPHVSTT